eukprot:1718785-Heterocapsa_arctica.AAC.1
MPRLSTLSRRVPHLPPGFFNPSLPGRQAGRGVVRLPFVGASPLRVASRQNKGLGSFSDPLVQLPTPGGQLLRTVFYPTLASASAELRRPKCSLLSC